MRQSVILSGLGDPIFTKSLDGIRIADEILRRNISAEHSTSMTCIDQNSNGETLTLSNRYLIHKKFASEAIEITDVIDPNRHLRNLAGDDYKHTADNVVEYWQCKDLGKDSQFVFT